jgi:hypothetical protein
MGADAARRTCDPGTLADNAEINRVGYGRSLLRFRGSQILGERRNRDAFLNLILWAMTILAVAAMLQKYVTPGQIFGIIPVSDSVVGAVYYKNWLAAMMELAAPIALWQVYNGKIAIGVLCYATMFAATITSESRMGVILLLVEFLVALMLLVAGRRMRTKSAVSLVAILALLVAPPRESPARTGSGNDLRNRTPMRCEGPCWRRL